MLLMSKPPPPRRTNVKHYPPRKGKAMFAFLKFSMSTNLDLYVCIPRTNHHLLLLRISIGDQHFCFVSSRPWVFFSCFFVFLLFCFQDCHWTNTNSWKSIRVEISKAVDWRFSKWARLIYVPRTIIYDWLLRRLVTQEWKKKQQIRPERTVGFELVEEVAYLTGNYVLDSCDSEVATCVVLYDWWWPLAEVVLWI